ncbi:MAG: hypothetical protein AAGI52_06455 [Bacteroidota bacterium]
MPYDITRYIHHDDGSWELGATEAEGLTLEEARRRVEAEGEMAYMLLVTETDPDDIDGYGLAEIVSQLSGDDWLLKIEQAAEVRRLLDTADAT